MDSMVTAASSQRIPEGGGSRGRGTAPFLFALSLEGKHRGRRPRPGCQQHARVFEGMFRFLFPTPERDRNRTAAPGSLGTVYMRCSVVHQAGGGDSKVSEACQNRDGIASCSVYTTRPNITVGAFLLQRFALIVLRLLCLSPARYTAEFNGGEHINIRLILGICGACTFNTNT